jgi:DNA-binding NtrC family response regulator
LPPLRERREDIPLLLKHFLTRLNQKTGKDIRDLTEAAMRACLDHPWPGNVRELENAVEHAFVLCAGSRIEVDHLPREIREGSGWAGLKTPATAGRHGATKTITREKLIDLLLVSGWNKAEAARKLEISRTAVWKLMKKWNIPLKSENAA